MKPEAAETTRVALIEAFRQQLRTHLSDAKMPQKQMVFEKMLAWLMSQPALTQSLRS